MSWGAPDSWNTAGSPSGITLTEETSIVHSGTSSVKLEWTNTDTVWMQQLVAINGGSEYSYSCRVYDNDPNGRARLYIRFRNIGGGFVGTALSSPYTTDSSSWQELTILASAAPADAVSAEFQIRCYDIAEWTGSAVVYVDDASMQGDISDTAPPVDILIRVIDQDSIEITFNEEGANAFSGESYEGSLVEIRNALIGNLMGNDRAGGAPDEDRIWNPDANYEIFYYSDTGVMRIYSGTNIDGTPMIPIPISASYKIRGILKQYKSAPPYNSGYSLCPRSLDDIMPNYTNVRAPWNLYE